jgi:hypothetical protein
MRFPVLHDRDRVHQYIELAGISQRVCAALGQGRQSSAPGSVATEPVVCNHLSETATPRKTDVIRCAEGCHLTRVVPPDLNAVDSVELAITTPVAPQLRKRTWAPISRFGRSRADGLADLGTGRVLTTYRLIYPAMPKNYKHRPHNHREARSCPFRSRGRPRRRRVGHK